jgi:DNA invertase Pin-like site-specific DNA recombinase
MTKRRKPLCEANQDRSSAVIGYIRVSTDEQADSGLGLAAQRASIEAECSRRGWTLAAVYEDAGYSARTLGRPAMSDALAALAAGQACALVVAKLDRATRSVIDAARLLERCQSEGWRLVALDLGLDLTTATGELMANVLASVAQWERRAIGDRTRTALAAKKAAGVRLGRPRLLDPAIGEQIRSRRANGATLQAIADELNINRITTPTGRAWSPALVRKVTLQSSENAAA